MTALLPWLPTIVAIITAAVALGTTSRWVIGDLPGSLTESFAGRIASARVYDTAQPVSWWQDVYKRGAGLYRGQ